MADGKPELNSLALAAELTVAWLSNPNVNAAAGDVPAFLRTIHGTLNELAGGSVARAEAEAEPSYTPAVSPRASVKPDYLVSLIDGKRYKTLRRHLSTHGLTPEAYRQRYGLKPDYPMVAPSYSSMRREAAARIGLGRKPPGSDAASDAVTPAAEAAPMPADTTSTAASAVISSPAPAADAPPISRRGRKAAAPAGAAAPPQPRRARTAEAAPETPEAAPKGRRGRTASAKAEQAGLETAKAPRRRLGIVLRG